VAPWVRSRAEHVGRGPVPKQCMIAIVGEVRGGGRHGGACCGRLLGAGWLTVRSWDQFGSGKLELVANDQVTVDLDFGGGGHERPDAQ
jgi:hypothetical protein